MLTINVRKNKKYIIFPGPSGFPVALFLIGVFSTHWLDWLVLTLALITLTNFPPDIIWGSGFVKPRARISRDSCFPVNAQIIKNDSLRLKVWADLSTSASLSTFWSELLKSNVPCRLWFPSLWVSTFFCWPPPCEAQIWPLTASIPFLHLEPVHFFHLVDLSQINQPWSSVCAHVVRGDRDFTGLFWWHSF